MGQRESEDDLGDLIARLQTDLYIKQRRMAVLLGSFYFPTWMAGVQEVVDDIENIDGIVPVKPDRADGVREYAIDKPHVGEEVAFAFEFMVSDGFEFQGAVEVAYEQLDYQTRIAHTSIRSHQDFPPSARIDCLQRLLPSKIQAEPTWQAQYLTFSPTPRLPITGLE